jgi:catechol 2,3-dioxygenase-like lactoylglutathione lyase family enzyme
MAHWQGVVPQLPVRDVEASQRWYSDVLELGINWLWEDNFGSVGMDHVELFLYASDDRRPVYVSLFVDDVDAVYDACRARGGEIASALELKPWNVREFSLRDPDGHILRIGTNVDADVVPEELTVHPEKAGT